ncbi:UNVERIFIED_CONTAM: hypothetical protein Cloal_2104 [Acetivibrio alkalicellulosi]
MLKKGDIILFGIISVIIAFSTLWVYYYRLGGNDSARIAVIKQGDTQIHRIILDNVTEGEKIKVSGAYNVIIHVEHDRIRFCEADCPDQVCVNTGWISKKGEMAACLPNRTMIKIEEGDEDVDIISH